MGSYWVGMILKPNDWCPSKRRRLPVRQRRSCENRAEQRLGYAATSQGIHGPTLAGGRNKEGSFLTAFRGSVALLIL